MLNNCSPALPFLLFILVSSFSTSTVFFEFISFVEEKVKEPLAKIYYACSKS